MAPPDEAVVKKPKGSRTVVLLKNDDYSRKNGKVYIPNTIEMAQIKKPIRGQYKKYVQFSKNMDEDMVKHQLQEAFPTFDLMNGRFSCAAVTQDSITFQFHGTPRVWDGKTIRRLITGNSVLYVVMEGDQIPQQSQLYTATEGCGSSTDGELMLFHEPAALNRDIGETPGVVAETEMEVDDSQQGNDDELATCMYGISAPSVNQMGSDTSEDVFSSTDNATTSGMVSGSDLECSEEDRLIQWLRNVGNLQISINPLESPLEGGAPCLFTFNPMLHSEVTSGHANFENLAMVPLERLRNGSLHGIIPASQQPGLVSVTLTSQHGICLGKTHIKYYGRKEVLNTIVRSPILVKEICEEYSMVYGFGETNMEAINSGILGITDPMQLFRLLVYTAAEVGAQQFIEMIFNSSAGRVVFEAYKGSSQLPEVIARDHGNEETAQYLERLTKRFSDEVRSGKECSQTIDWSELAKAAEAAQKKLDVTNEKEDGLDERNDPKETSYLGDAESSSSEALVPQSSDSEDDISTRTKPTATAATTTTTAPRKASSVPAVANVTLRSQDGIILGKTRVTYGVNLQQVVSSPRALKKFCEDYMSGNQSGNLSGNSGGETESSRTLGCHKPVQMLSLSVYVAAEIGAQQFIEIIFTSSAGRVVHNAYKGNLTLPETIARDHGNEETANYLEDVTKRFSEETTTDDECSETIDWSELVKAAEAAEKQFDLTSEKEDDKIQKEIPKETGYLGDIDTSSSKSSETQSSDSDDDISRTSRKGSISGRECKIGLQRDQHREDRTGDTEEPNGGINRDFTETLHQFDLTSKNENGQVKSDDPKETGYLEDADASSSEASAPQSSDPEDDISVGTTTKTPATTTTATRKGYISGRECQDRKGAIVKDPTGGNDRDFTETLHQFDFKSEKENYQTEIDLPQETGYSGDEETSTSESSEPQSFDSKDDFARTSWKVPPEILTRGPLALEAYKKALSEGKTSVKTVPVIFIGQDRCGKTSLKKSLVREPFNPHEDIKVKVDVDPIYFKVSTETWKEEEDRETGFEAAVSYEQATARLVEETFLECRDMPSVSGLRFPDVLEDLQWSEKSKDPGSNQTYKEPADIDSKNSCDEPGGGKCSTTITSLTNLRQTIFQEVDIVEDQEEIHPVLWDFTGQSVYYTTNPLFLTARAIYLLVHDLSLNPYERARSSLKQGTNLDYLDFWMSCVASIATERDEQGSKSEVFPEKNPPVLLVCTHADRAYGGFDARTLANNVFGSLQTNSNQTHSCKDVFVVDNTNSECSEVMRLRDKIRDVAMELPQIKEAIPIKWLRYEKALQVMKEKWITIDGAKEIASQVCDVVDDDQFHTLLSFLHEKRILIHFDDTPELNRLVVLDPQWLIDECNKLVIISPYHDREKGEFEEPWRKLKQEGILEEKLLEHIWFPLFHSKEILESFTAMMEKFSLLCLLPSPDAFCRKQYLVPSMLSHPPGGNEEVICSTPVPPLFLVFESGCVPLGLFPRLVLKFFQWIKVKYTSPLDPQLCHNFARFYTSEERNFSVDLLCHSCTIEVVLHPGYSSHDLEDSLKSKLSMSADASYNTCARAVCRQLGLILGSMGKEFPWLKNMKYGFSLICPVCCHGGTVNYCRTHHTRGCKKEECLHFWPVPESCNAEQMFCTRSAAALNNRICAEQLAPWFASLGEQHAVNENGGMHLRYVDDSALNLPDEVPDSLLSLQVNLHNDEEIVPMEGCLQPSQTSPEQPKPDLFKGVMLDVAKNPREITTAETTGPLSKEHLDVHNISVYQRREVAIESSGGDEWKVVAQELNQLDNFILHPFDAALASISSLRY